MEGRKRNVCARFSSMEKKIRDGVMAKALLPLVALHNRGLRNPGLEEGREHYPGWGWACNFFLRVLYPRGTKDFGVLQGHI